MSNTELNYSKESLQYLVELGAANATKAQEPKEILIHGEKYLIIRNELKRFEERQPVFSDKFTTYSLQGLVDFLKADVDKYFDTQRSMTSGEASGGPKSFDRFIVRVTSPTQVDVFTPVFGPQRSRECIASCSISLPPIIFDRYLPAEDMLIMLHTRFEEDRPASDDTAEILPSNRDLAMQLVGNLRNEQSNETADDGFSQRINVKSGIAGAKTVKVENPIYLIPKRTFHEVVQPGSPFVLRFKADAENKDVGAALFESDGGVWKYAAVKNIAAWLTAELKYCETPVPVEIIA